MRTTLNYSGNRYGNNAPILDYLIVVENSSLWNEIQLQCRFANPAEGRGVGPSVGLVQSWELALTPEAAAHLAHLLLAATDGPSGCRLTSSVHERVPSPRARPAA